MSGRVEKVGQYKWKQGDTTYVLTDLPDSPCHECGGEIGEDKYCYFRDSPENFDHVCWDCGRKVTGFGEPGGSR